MIVANNMKDVLKDCEKRDKRHQRIEDIFMGSVFVIVLITMSTIYFYL